MKLSTRIAAASVITALSASLTLSPAFAGSQNVNATLGSSVSMTSSPADIASGAWILANTGANTNSGGTVAINSNAPYTVSVTADKATMTEYAASAYVTSGHTLTSPLTVSATRASGTAAVAGVGAAAVVGTSTLLATGTGLGTDSYSLTLSQPTLITDHALPSGEVYHIVLSYTASSTLG